MNTHIRRIKVVLILIIYLTINLNYVFANGDKSEKVESNTVESLFCQIVKSEGVEYTKARNQLLAIGDKTKPFLQEKVKAESWEESLTSEILLAWLENSDEFTKFEKHLYKGLPYYPDNGIHPRLVPNPKKFFFVDDKLYPTPLLIEFVWKRGNYAHWWIVSWSISMLRQGSTNEPINKVVLNLILNRIDRNCNTGIDCSSVVKSGILFLEEKGDIKELTPTLVQLLRKVGEAGSRWMQESETLKLDKTAKELLQWQIRYTIRSINKEVKLIFIRNGNKEILDILQEEVEKKSNAKVKDLLEGIISEIKKKIDSQKKQEKPKSK